MATSLKLRRGTTTAHGSFTGAEAEVTVDTTKDTVVVHDGSTAGGFPLLREDLSNNTNVTTNTNTQTLTNKTLSAPSVSGNLTFTGTGNRITGDFSNATFANRVVFQSSTTNGLVQIPILPNGTATTAGILPFNNSDTTNAAYFLFAARSTDATLVSGITGTGTYLPMTFYTGGSERMSIDTSGNVGIGTSSPSSLGKLAISGATDPIFALEKQGAWNSQLTIEGSTGSFIIKNGGTERMRIDSSGNVLVGTTSVSDSCKQTLQFSTGNNGLCVITPDNINGVDFSIFRANGAVCGRISRVGTTSAVVYTTTSDKRLKENITDAPSALEYLNKIKVRSFDWKDCGHHINYGVIAQEFIDVEPDAVLKGDDEEEIIKTWSVDTSVLVPAMIKAIQEQQELIKQLQADVALLKGN